MYTDAKFHSFFSQVPEIDIKNEHTPTILENITANAGCKPPFIMAQITPTTK
jgi:hypothetical protein